MDIPAITIYSYRGHRVSISIILNLQQDMTLGKTTLAGDKRYICLSVIFFWLIPFPRRFQHKCTSHTATGIVNVRYGRPPLPRGPPIAPDARCGWGSALSALLTSSLLGFSLLWQTYVNMVVYYTNRRTGALQVWACRTNVFQVWAPKHPLALSMSLERNHCWCVIYVSVRGKLQVWAYRTSVLPVKPRHVSLASYRAAGERWMMRSLRGSWW